MNAAAVVDGAILHLTLCRVKRVESSFAEYTLGPASSKIRAMSARATSIVDRLPGAIQAIIPLGAVYIPAPRQLIRGLTL